MIHHEINNRNQTSSLSDEVYRTLCADIADGVFKPGERLGIERIAKLKGVSHMPVREALQRMSCDGLAEKTLNCGFRVKRLSNEDGKEIWAIRIALETLAMRWLMSQKISKKMLCELRENCELYRKNTLICELYRLDIAFHNIIINYCGAKQVRDILSRRMILLNSFYLSNSIVEIPTLDSIERCYREHLGIIECIESGDADRAEKAMSSHLEFAFTTCINADR